MQARIPCMTYGQLATMEGGLRRNPTALYQKRKASDGHIVTLTKKKDKTGYLVALMEQKRQLCMVKLNLFDAKVPTTDVDRDHPAMVKAVSLLTSVADKYVSGEIEDVWAERNKMLDDMGIRHRSTKGVAPPLPAGDDTTDISGGAQKRSAADASAGSTTAKNRR